MNEIIEQLRRSLSQGSVITDPDLLQTADASEMPKALLKPKSTDEVCTIMKLCHAAKQPIVPRGGMTGLVQGTQTTKQEIALSLDRMNQIEEVDVQSRTMTVQAGVLLQQVQERAEQEQLLFPLDLGARGSATIGGNVATNAGGNRVIRYGMMRDQILGMEVVLADGTLITAMHKIIKNNTGYDLKQLFVGSEGTLGVITRLVLRMRPLPGSQDLAYVAVDSFKNVIRFLNQIDTALGGTMSAFEVLWQNFYQLVTTPPATGRPPLSQEHKYYILLEAMGGDPDTDHDRFLLALNDALESALISDAVIARNQAERDSMWAIRDDIGQLQQYWPIFAFDISVSLNSMESYVDETKQALVEKWLKHTCTIFGHLGDGNLHIVVGVGDDSAETKQLVEEVVYKGLISRGGSISAEHGIGLQKRPYLSWSRSRQEIRLMQTIKQALDPTGILNPGKILA